MKIIVTGGAGFIGTNLCEGLVKQGYAVRVIDNLSVSDVNVPHLESMGVEVVQADIVDYSKMHELFAGFDAAIHLAAMNRAQRSIEDPLRSNDVNITGTLHCLEAARQSGMKKFVNVSSSSVYANREGDLLQEDASLAPLHPYGVGKLAGEHYARIYHELYDLNTVSLRFFSVYGPRQLGSIDKAGVVAKFIDHALQGQSLEIYGNGEQLRNFSFVRDVVECVTRALESDAAIGEVINVANSREITVNYLAELVKKISGTNSEIVHTDPLKGDPARNPANVEKCKQLLGYEAKIDFEEGVTETYNWYKEN